jgi:hypothetical protein
MHRLLIRLRRICLKIKEGEMSGESLRPEGPINKGET